MLKFHHAPWSRGSGVLWLLEELGIGYEMIHEDIRLEGGAPESYRNIQPNKKVPAIEHDGAIVTERSAITVYLAEAFPDAGLNVPAGDPDRARFLVWNVYCDSVIDPVLCARAKKLEYTSNEFPFGLFEPMVANVEKHLKANDFAAGSRFTAADTQLGSAIAYTMNVLKLMPELPALQAYVERFSDRPAYRRAEKIDYDLAMTTPYFKEYAGAGEPVDA